MDRAKMAVLSVFWEKNGLSPLGVKQAIKNFRNNKLVEVEKKDTHVTINSKLNLRIKMKPILLRFIIYMYSA